MEKNEMGRACSLYGGEERCRQGLVGKPEGWRPLGRTRHRREDNIKMDLREMGWQHGLELILLRTGTGGGLL
jgi:hypothetical protein